MSCGETTGSSRNLLFILTGNALAQDAKAVIANAQLVRRSQIHHLLGIGEGRRVPAVRSQCRRDCRGDPMRPITNYVRVIDLAAPASRHTGGTSNIGAGGSTTVTPGTFFQQVTPQQADVAQPWGGSLELYITPWGFLKGAADNNATARRSGKFTVVSWSPKVMAPSGKPYVINSYVDEEHDRPRRDVAR